MKRDREAVGRQSKGSGKRRQNNVVAKFRKARNKSDSKRESLVSMVWRCRKDMRVYAGQGTTEYAILVGVLVVIAILAITVFRPRLQELWDAIASGINSL